VSRILSQNKSDEKINAVKVSIKNFLSEVSKRTDNKFSGEEVENILLDIYNVVN